MCRVGGIRRGRQRPCACMHASMRDGDCSGFGSGCTVGMVAHHVTFSVTLIYSQTHMHTCAFRRRCAHTANSKPLTADQSWSLPSARGTMDKSVVAAGQLDRVPVCVFNTHLSAQILGSFTLLVVISRSRLLQYVSVSSVAKEEESNRSFLLCIAVRLQPFTQSQVCQCHTPIASAC